MTQLCSKMQMAGDHVEPPELGGEAEGGKQSGDETDAKPDRKGRFLLFGR